MVTKSFGSSRRLHRRGNAQRTTHGKPNDASDPDASNELRYGHDATEEPVLALRASSCSLALSSEPSLKRRVAQEKLLKLIDGVRHRSFVTESVLLAEPNDSAFRCGRVFRCLLKSSSPPVEQAQPSLIRRHTFDPRATRTVEREVPPPTCTGTPEPTKQKSRPSSRETSQATSSAKSDRTESLCQPRGLSIADALWTQRTAEPSTENGQRGVCCDPHPLARCTVYRVRRVRRRFQRAHTPSQGDRQTRRLLPRWRSDRA
jgi:hypothetical protein